MTSQVTPWCFRCGAVSRRHLPDSVMHFETAMSVLHLHSTASSTCLGRGSACQGSLRLEGVKAPHGPRGLRLLATAQTSVSPMPGIPAGFQTSTAAAPCCYYVIRRLALLANRLDRRPLHLIVPHFCPLAQENLGISGVCLSHGQSAS